MAQVFVTGGSGFIGQVLVRRLLAEGHSVGVLVRSGTSAARSRRWARSPCGAS
ncbi:NAD-dependent epimerase/dehydratase family protein [Streptomyces aureus]|uniref:NAD-dependent epimerase/dehydratase family protein n=1 Tax=Streptomyces aureus TaxID=193461 RepID=UPI0036294BE5